MAYICETVQISLLKVFLSRSNNSRKLVSASGGKALADPCSYQNN